MARSKPRLILVPQFPVDMRYQSWYWWYLRERYLEYFDEVVQIGTGPECRSLKDRIGVLEPQHGQFFGLPRYALEFEAAQIREYMQLPLRPDDVLLLCDLSFPGTFALSLIHKRPNRCFAICHATAKNRYDVFRRIRRTKYALEKASAQLFDAVFVATNYHAEKLGWPNIYITGSMPHPPIDKLRAGIGLPCKSRDFVSVARRNPQKINYALELEFQRRTGQRIARCRAKTWREYYDFVASGRFLIVTSREETFGYQVIDALSVGTIPIAPKAYSYPELLPDECLYQPGSVNSIIECIETLRQRHECPQKPVDMFFYTTSKVMLS